MKVPGSLALAATIAVAAFALLLASCGDNANGTANEGAAGGSPSATATQDASPPSAPSYPDTPALVLTTTGGQSQAAEPGTRCWANMCLDYIGPITPVVPLPAAVGSLLALTVDYEPQPSGLHAAWVRVDGTEGTETGADTLAWQVSLDTLVPIEIEDAKIQTPGTPGDWILVIAGVWEQDAVRGDILWGAYLTLT